MAIGSTKRIVLGQVLTDQAMAGRKALVVQWRALKPLQKAGSAEVGPASIAKAGQKGHLVVQVAVRVTFKTAAATDQATAITVGSVLQAPSFLVL